MKYCPICSNEFGDETSTCPAHGVVLVPLSDWAPGTLIKGTYRILGRLGRGGMGMVYRAEHLTLQEPRALKVMREDLAADPRFTQRFLQEAKIAGRLFHPNSVRLYDFNQAEDGKLFIAMEYVEGVSLRELLATAGRLEVSRALLVTRQVADVLANAHALGIVHRDLKPDNLMLTRDPLRGEQVKVMDFGIAAVKETIPGGTLTRSGVMVGTGFYASPEQFRGVRGRELDGRSDIYSLGVTLYEMLAGRPPFEADDFQVLRQMHLEEPPPPFAAELGIPPGVERLVQKMLGKKPDERPPDALALTRELNALEAQLTWAQPTRPGGEPRPGRAPGPPSPPGEETLSVSGEPLGPPLPTPAPSAPPREPRKPVEPTRAPAPTPAPPRPSPAPTFYPTAEPSVWARRKGWLGLAAVAALAVVLVLVWQWWPPASPPDETEPASEPVQQAPVETEQTQPASEAARQPPVETEPAQPEPSPPTETKPTQPSPTPAAALPTVELRAEPTAIEPGQATTLSWESTNATELALEPGLGAVGRQGTKSVSPTEDTTYRLVGKGRGGTAEDSIRVTVRLVVPEFALRHTLTGHTWWVSAVTFSPDGRWLASANHDYTVIKLWEVTSGREVRTLRGGGRAPAFSPDGRWLASASTDNTVKLWEVTSGRLVRTLTGHTSSVNAVAFSPDGRWLASASRDWTVRLWEVASGRLVRTLTGHTNDVSAVAFSPDGRWLASCSSDKTVKLWRRVEE
ncbi:protein kinase [Acidobacteriia bacterium AH_259_A11_L15]|nr:protein kinase [Acidobacteriia bacterium AH_259_A11_L15]